MIHNPIPRDEAPDTRHDAETRRFDGLYELPRDTDVPPNPDSADFAPDTSPSIDVLADAGNQRAKNERAKNARPSEEPTAEAEVTKIIGADRKTLPSAQFLLNTAPTAPTARADLSWDQEPEPQQIPQQTPTPFPEKTSAFPEENTEQSAESPSLWGRVQRFVANLGKKQSTAPPTAPNARTARISGERPALQAIFNAAWALDDGEIDELSAHLEKIVALRRLGADAYAEARILDVLNAQNTQSAHEDDENQTTTVSSLRAQLPEIPKHAFDEALLRLEERQSISLGPADEIAERHPKPRPHQKRRAS